MEDTGPALLLSPSDLTSKWGFGDGDICDEVIDDLIDASAWVNHFPPRDSDERFNVPASTYLSPRALLTELVRRLIVPKLPDEYRCHVHRVATVHNPVQLWLEEMDDDALDEELSALEPVALSDEQLREVFNQRFPMRPKGWLALFDALYVSFSLLDDDALNVATPAGEFVHEGHLRLCRYVDACAESFADDELLLAAHLLVGDTTTRFFNASINVGSVEDRLATARRVLLDPPKATTPAGV